MCFAEDCNSNGIEDSIDISSNGDSNDCNTNSIPDECDIASGAGSDCNYSNILDSCEIAWGFCDDVNTNGVPDECELHTTSTSDCNGNGIPDSCDVDCGEVGGECFVQDCGGSRDCNGNVVPDECEIVEGFELDCDANGIIDSQQEYLPVDIFFVGDTSGSTGTRSDMSAFCNLIRDIEAQFSDRCIDVKIKKLGINYIEQCLDESIYDNWGLSNTECENCNSNSNCNCAPLTSSTNHGDDPSEESWGMATAVLAEAEGKWRKGAVRIVVPMGDESPCQGNRPGDITCHEDDWQIAYIAASSARKHHVHVFPLIGTLPFDDGIHVLGCSWSAAARIASESGGQAFEMETVTSQEFFDAIMERIEDASIQHADCNANDVPDLCEIDSGSGADCDGTHGNGWIDDCEQDCDNNGVADSCELATGAAIDINENWIIDSCEGDCNENGISDPLDIANGTSEDCDCNGIPDECEGILYVRAGAEGSKSGMDWENAYTSLLEAMEHYQQMQCPAIREIRVAEGTYYPSDDGDTGDSFALPDGFVLKGGYKGVGPDPDTRAPFVYRAVISGEIDSDENDDTGNSRRMIEIFSVDNVTVDGFVISGCYSGSTDYAMIISGTSSNPAVANIRNCSFENNHNGDRGAALFISTPASLTIENCRFDSNISTGSGGAIYAQSSSVDPSFVLTLQGCQFTNNSSGKLGGALYLQRNYDLVCGNCIFTGNSVTDADPYDSFHSGDGGAVYLDESQNVQFVNCAFDNNEASFTERFGGGICSHVAGELSIVDCHFNDNDADGFGGAIYASEGSVHVDRCVFADNSCSYSVSDGGAIYAWVDSSSITNSLFVGNQAAYGGAVGLYIGGSDPNYYEDETFNFVNNTVVYNTATAAGGGLEISGHRNEGEGEFSYANVINTILFGNSSSVSGSQIGNYYVQYYPELDVVNSDIQGGATGIGYPNNDYDWINSINEDPLFYSDTGDSSGDYHLTSPGTNCNPCIDEGYDSSLLEYYSFDLDVVTRELIGCDSSENPIVDIGAYEFWDCNGDGISEGVVPIVSYDLDTDIDLADFAKFQDCVLDDDPDKKPDCLDWFDRAPSSCGVIDAADYSIFYSQFSGPDIQGVAAMASMMASPALGEVAENVGETAEDCAEPAVEPDSWTIQEGDLVITFVPLSGGQAVTTLAPNTSYVMNYQADYPADDFVVVAYAGSSAQGLASARIPDSGDWSACTAFSCLDIQTLQGELGEPDGDGLRRTDVVTGTLPIPCSTSGQLCIFKTGNAGTLKLDVELIRVDESTQVVSTMHRETTVDVVSN